MSTRRIRRAHARRSKFAAAAGTALGATAIAAPAADAATFTVTSLADNGAEGTLREEIEDANAQNGDDVIVFESGLSGTITLDDDDIPISSDGLEIQGPGASQITVDGDYETRMFLIGDMDAEGESVLISGLTFANGYADPDDNQFLGGVLYNDQVSGETANLTIAGSVMTNNRSSTAGGGGAIWHDNASLTVADSILTGNEARSDDGGGLYARGETVSIRDSRVIGNSAAFYGGGMHLRVTEDVSIQNSVISDNAAEQDGGGIRVDDVDGDVLIADTTISGNESGGAGGGGIHVNGADISSVTVSRATVSDNYTSGHGGGLEIWRTAGPVTIANSTVSGNATEDSGGGIYLYSDTPNVRTVRNSTVVDNVAQDDGGGIYVFQYFGGGFDEADELNVSSTIVAGNSASAEPDLGQTPDSNSPPAAFNVGFSLVGDESGATIAETPAGSNLFGVDPQLGPLASNGGPTQTHLPAATSPALDGGVANGLASDQRGLARTGDLSTIPNAAGSDATDIGAVELQVADCQGQSVPRSDGTSGDDTITGTEGSDAIFGLAGNDTADGSGGNDCVSGDEGKDNVRGGAGADQVNGGAGKDKASGGGGKDRVKGDAGKDKVKGGGGKDRVNGGGGKDKLSGGGGKDRLKGGPGKDRLKGGGGKDRFNCGGGKDKVTAQAKDKVSASCEKVVEKG